MKRWTLQEFNAEVVQLGKTLHEFYCQNDKVILTRKTPRRGIPCDRDKALTSPTFAVWHADPHYWRKNAENGA